MAEKTYRIDITNDTRLYLDARDTVALLTSLALDNKAELDYYTIAVVNAIYLSLIVRSEVDEDVGSYIKIPASKISAIIKDVKKEIHGDENPQESETDDVMKWANSVLNVKEKKQFSKFLKKVNRRIEKGSFK